MIEVDRWGETYCKYVGLVVERRSSRNVNK